MAQERPPVKWQDNYNYHEDSPQRRGIPPSSILEQEPESRGGGGSPALCSLILGLLAWGSGGVALGLGLWVLNVLEGYRTYLGNFQYLTLLNAVIQDSVSLLVALLFALVLLLVALILSGVGTGFGLGGTILHGRRGLGLLGLILSGSMLIACIVVGIILLTNLQGIFG